MLTHLYIRNFVLVTECEIDFQGGMTVLTGETGAGKSIIFDALGLAIGKRAESHFIRHDCDQTEIVATFQRLTPEIQQWLELQEIEATEDELILRRVIRRDGRSRAFINSIPSTIQSLQQLSTLLIDIQGQHAHQRLLKREEQQRLLDQYGDHETLLQEMAQHHQQWRQLTEQHQHLQQSETERQDRIALLKFQLEELAPLQLETEPPATLAAEQERLANGEQLITLGQQALQQLDGEDEQNAIQQLHRTLSQLESLESLDPAIAPLREELYSATLQASEVASGLRDQFSSYQLDPSRLQWLNERLSLLSDLARKHRCKSHELPEKQQALQRQLEQLEGRTEQLESLQQEIESAYQQCLQCSQQLHQARAQAAKQLQQEVTREIQQLGMEQGQFEVTLNSLPDRQFRSHGADEILFQIRANPGNPLQPLSKTASGGELSRISLAIQLASANRGQTPTLIFDEVDSGVGGGTAERIGQKLHQLGESTQILCVTHLPQVASQGHHHLKIEKQSIGEKETSSTMTILQEAARVAEIARMIGGIEITEQTTATAQEMLQPITRGQSAEMSH